MIKTIFRATLLAAMVMAVTVIANAGPVTYHTLGCFGAACAPIASDSIAVGGGSLVYTGQASITIFPTPITAAQLGEFSWTGSPSALAFGPVDFTLRIVQTAPPGSGDFTATISGSVSTGPTFSTFVVSFDSVVLSIGDVTYRLINLGQGGILAENEMIINPPGQTTSVQAVVTNVPEPASMLLLGTGLLGAAGAVRRRFKRD